MSDKYDLLRSSIQALAVEAQSNGAVNPREQLIIELVADYDALGVKLALLETQPAIPQAAPTPVSGGLALVYDLFGLDYSQPTHVLLANIENTRKFSSLLHAVEREFFMVPGEPSDEAEDEGFPPDDECLLNSWGSNQDEYIEQFRKALAVIALGTLKSQLGEQQPAAYADPQAFENFKATGRTGGASSREWMWAMPAPGLVAVYREPFAEDCLAGEAKGQVK